MFGYVWLLLCFGWFVCLGWFVCFVVVVMLCDGLVIVIGILYLVSYYMCCWWVIWLGVGFVFG